MSREHLTNRYGGNKTRSSFGQLVNPNKPGGRLNLLSAVFRTAELHRYTPYFYHRIGYCIFINT